MYEDLLDEVQQMNLNIYELPLEAYAGRIIGNNIIIKKDMTASEKSCAIAEELGHFQTSEGDILDYSSTDSAKQERKARLWAAKKLISFDDIIAASKSGIRNIFELSEFLNVTEDFLRETLDIWQAKYGNYIAHKDKIILLNPLGVIDKIQF